MATITELAAEYGVTLRTLRHYEELGLLSPQRVGSRRVYRQRDRVRLALILRGKRLGFSISEIREIIHMYKTPPGEAAQLRVIIRRVGERRSELEQKRRDIEDLLAELDNAEEACLTRMAELGIPQTA